MNSKKLTGLLISCMMMTNPLAAGFAAGEETTKVEVVETQPGESNAQTVIGIDINDTGSQIGAVVSAEADNAAADLTVTNAVQTTSEDDMAAGAYISSTAEQSDARLTAGEVSTTGEDDASAVFAEASGKQSAAAVIAENVAAVSENGSATGAEISSSGEQSSVVLTAGNVTAEGAADAFALRTNASGESSETVVNAEKISAAAAEGNAVGAAVYTDGKGTETTVNTGEVSAKANENATAVRVDVDGSNHTLNLTAGEVTAEGKSDAAGINANLWMDSSDNTLNVKADTITSTAEQTEAYGIASHEFGASNAINVTAGDVKVEGKSMATGIEAIVSEEGSDSTTVIKTGNLDVVTDSAATGIHGRAAGNGNTIELTGENVTVGGGRYSIGLDAESYYGNNTDEQVGSDNKTIINAGDVKATAASQGKTGSSSATGVSGYAEGEGNTAEITAGNIIAEVVSEGGVEVDAYADGVLGQSWDGGKTRITTGNVEVKAISKSEYDETSGTEDEVYASVSGVDGTAAGKGSVLEIKTGSVAATVVEEGGSYYEEYNAGVSLLAFGAGNIAFTADGDVVLSFTKKITERDIASSSSSDTTEDEAEEEAGTYTGTGESALRISVVGSESEVSAIINGSVRATGSDHYTDREGIVYESPAIAGVVIGDDYIGETLTASDSELIAEVGGTDDVLGTANVKIEGDILSNGNGLEVVPTYSGGNINVIVEGTIRGDTGAVIVNDKVDAGNFTLTVWKIDPTTPDETAGEEGDADATEQGERYLSVLSPEGEGHRNDTDAEEKLLKQVQYIIKVDPNITNASVNLEGTERFTDFTGEEYDIAHEDDKVVIRISADAGYRLTGAFNGEGKEETLLRDSDGNYYIIVPRGGGVYLTATVEEIVQDRPEERESSAVRVSANKEEGWAGLDETESGGRVTIAAVNRLLKGAEKKELAALSPIQQLLVVLTKAGFSEAAAASGVSPSEETKHLIDRLNADLRGAVQTIYRYENGVKVKWYMVEMNLPGNRIARFAFRQLEDGSWMMKML